VEILHITLTTVVKLHVDCITECVSYDA